MGKRCATGYNLYIKDCYDKTGDFKGCLMNKGWSKESDDVKNKYNKKASEQCKI